MFKSGIYQIRNIDDGKCYIGLAKDLHRRKTTHWRSLNNGKHFNSHLQSAWNLYGSTRFVFEILEYVSDFNRLEERERWWLWVTSNTIIGYNTCTSARLHIGVKRSEVTKKKMVASLKATFSTPEMREKMSRLNKGRTVSEETRRKLREASTGKCLPSETKQKISDSLKGNPYTQNMRDALQRRNVGNKIWLGKHHSEDSRQKMSEAAVERERRKKESGWKPKPHSEETKQKMRDAYVKRCQNKKPDN